MSFVVEESKKENWNYIFKKIENRLFEKYESAVLAEIGQFSKPVILYERLLELECKNLQLKGDVGFEDSEVSSEDEFSVDLVDETDGGTTDDLINSDLESGKTWVPENRELEDIIEESEEEFEYRDENHNSFECHICEKAFKIRSGLKRHVETHKRRFKCNRCDKIFKTMLDLKVHRHVHAHEKPFECDFCGVGFKATVNLQEHRRIHTGEKYDCDICGKKFTQKAGLNSHKKTHTDDGSRPFECDKCDSKFKNLAGLRAHELAHSDDRPFSCEMCFKKYKTRSQLKDHERSHKQEKNFECDICHKRFVTATVVKNSQKNRSRRLQGQV